MEVWFAILYIIDINIGSTYKEKKESKETARYKKALVATELFNMAVNDVDTKKSARYSLILVVTELFVSGAQCR